MPQHYDGREHLRDQRALDSTHQKDVDDRVNARKRTTGSRASSSSKPGAPALKGSVARGSPRPTSLDRSLPTSKKSLDRLRPHSQKSSVRSRPPQKLPRRETQEPRPQPQDRPELSSVKSTPVGLRQPPPSAATTAANPAEAPAVKGRRPTRSPPGGQADDHRAQAPKVKKEPRRSVLYKNAKQVGPASIVVKVDFLDFTRRRKHCGTNMACLWHTLIGFECYA